MNTFSTSMLLFFYYYLFGSLSIHFLIFFLFLPCFLSIYRQRKDLEYIYRLAMYLEVTKVLDSFMGWKVKYRQVPMFCWIIKIIQYPCSPAQPHAFWNPSFFCSPWISHILTSVGDWQYSVSGKYFSTTLFLITLPETVKGISSPFLKTRRAVGNFQCNSFLDRCFLTVVRSPL